MAVDTTGKYIPTANTKLLLHLDGNSTDSSGNANNGTDTAIVYSKVDKLHGNMGAGFNGISSIVTINDVNSLSFTNNTTDTPYTFSFWIYLTSYPSSGNYYGVISKRGSLTECEYYVIIFPNGDIEVLNFNQGTTGIYIFIDAISVVPLNAWTLVTLTYDGSGSENGFKCYSNSILSSKVGGHAGSYVAMKNGTSNLVLGRWIASSFLQGKLDEVIIESIAWDATQVASYYQETKAYYSQDKTIYHEGSNTGEGKLPSGDDSSISLNSWQGFKTLMNRSVEAGALQEVVSTYALVYSIDYAYTGGCLAPNGDIHFIPFFANKGQKISSLGVVSTYSLIYTNGSGAYFGGLLTSNGDIHFVPRLATVGQKVSVNGIVSTYSLVYTTSLAYYGGVLSPNGDIHFIPFSSIVGQKISSTGVVSTYSLVYTTAQSYSGGVLSPNGDIHFVPALATVGQKVSSQGVVSTYSLICTNAGGAYYGGVLALNGDIHFCPVSATVGQKVSINTIVSTYSLVYTVTGAYAGGTLSPNGDIHMIPLGASVGQKISSIGIVSTYSLVYTNTNGAYYGGVLNQNGEIHFIPNRASVGQKISTNSAKPFSLGMCCSPFFNKF